MKLSKLGVGLVASATVLAALAAQWGRGFEQARHPAGLMADAQGSAAVSPTSATVWPSDAPVGFGEWTYVGPDNVAGAAQDVVVEPTTGNLYALSMEGWVFRSTDGAATWNAVARFNTNLPMSRLEIQSDATGVAAYLGITGVDSYSTPHLLRMTPDGQTTDLTLNAFEVRTAGASIYATDSQGVWLSNDNGEHWNHVVAADSGVTPYCSDIEIAGSNVFVMCGMRGLYDTFYDGARSIYRSTSGGQFVKVWTAPAGMWTGYEGKLAVSRSNPNVVYASYRYGYGHGAYVFRTTDGGTSWQLRTDPAGANPFNNSLLTDFDQRCANDGYGRPTEDHVLEVDPANPDILWVGAIELYRSDDGGLNFGRASLDSSKGTGAYFLPRNIRALRFPKAYNGGSNRSVYIAAQDGVYSSADARAAVQAAPADMCSAPGAPPAMTWTKRIAGYTTAAFAAVDVTADGEVLASLGRRYVYASEEEENQAPSRGLFHGDLADPGSWARLSYVQPRLLTLDPMVGVDRFYTSRCPGGLYCRWDWSASLQRWDVTARQQDPQTSTPDDFRFLVSFTPDPSDRSRFWGKNLSRSTDGMSTWVSAGMSPSAPRISAGAVSPADPNLVLLVDEDGRLFRRTDALSTDASTTWSAADPFPFRFGANGVHFDPSDPSRVYAFGWDESNHKVFASNDAGQTWESADQPGAQDGLRDGEVRSLVTDIDSRDVLYVAADGSQPGESGLFVTWNYKNTNGPAWHAVPTPFEGASIAKLVMRKRSDGRKVLYAFTAGRGIWAATVSEHRFDDVPATHWAVDFINRLARAGVTSGCASNPPMYCPGDAVTRDQMAVFLLRAKHGSAYQPPAAIGVFSDVPTNHWAAPWIERLRDEGITNGCTSNPLQYCPGSAVTRDQMAVFLLRAKHGSAYQPPAAIGMFADVPTEYWAAPWIEQLSREGVTNGCASSPARYCPGNQVTRDQMAVFLVRAFQL